MKSNSLDSYLYFFIPKINSKTLRVVIFIFTIIALSNSQFCHGICHDYLGTCFDVTKDSCYVCALSMFKSKEGANLYSDCQPLDQTEILFNELDSQNMDVSTYTTSNPIMNSCTNITLSGQYVNTDYIEKNFTGITDEHY